MQSTIFAIVPALIAIVLALSTKEVYVSLLVGILTGTLLYTNFQFLDAIELTFTVLGEKVSNHLNIIFFLVLLGMLVAVLGQSGATRSYGEWAAKSIRTQRGALFATVGLGSLIFIDDYFNCMTVGTVMGPVTDRYQISRVKLAYIIDATAAPVCILAPVSSWAAAVGSTLPEGSAIDGFQLFLRTVPYNFYAILTILMVIFLIIFQFDFSSMSRYTGDEFIQQQENCVHREKINRGTVWDMVFPIFCLICLCIAFMLYTGGIIEGKSVMEAFAACDSPLALVMGAFISLIIVFFLYIPRKIMTFREFVNCLTEGFRAMVPAIVILTLAWTLGALCGSEYLDTGKFVGQIFGSAGIGMVFLPVLFFLAAMLLSFATGTSWGTFSILIPIAVSIFEGDPSELLVISVSAVLAGAVCGDHISPISDTTILSSAGAGCDHVAHVSTQLPYALLVAFCSAIGYLLAGTSQNGWISFGISFLILFGILTAALIQNKKKQWE